MPDDGTNDSGVVHLTLVRELVENAPDAPPPMPPLNTDAASIGQAISEREAMEHTQTTAGHFDEPPEHWSAGYPGGGGDDGAADLGLPKGCPVVALGKDGRTFYYLNAMRQLAELKDNEHGRLPLKALFAGKTSMLWDFWPRLNAKGEPVGVDFDEMADSLMDAAARAGVWSSDEKVRGPGAWLGDLGELVLHCGDAIRIGATPDADPGVMGAWHSPGLVGKYVYPAAEAKPRPVGELVQGGEDCGAAWLLGLLKSWNWKRGDLDAMLALGWIGAAMIGGALKWRPMAWITGGAGTGKSTLQEVIKGVHGGAIVEAPNASAAAIWQRLKHATLPVELDEAEAGEDNRKINAVIELARQAASGGVILRGGADHKGVEFTIRSCFLFGSILVPPLQPQDMSRMAILELQPLAAGSNLTLDHDHLERVGGEMRQRLVNMWATLPRILESYRDALGRVGHSQRGKDQFGTLLAVADALLVEDEIEMARCDAWAARLDASVMAAWTDAEADEARCLRHLLTSQIDPFRGGQRFNMIEWIERAAGFAQGTDAGEANRTLGTYGLMVDQADGKSWLYVANQHRGLDTIYQNTHWQGRSGTAGGWVQSLRRLDGAGAMAQPVYIGGVTVRATRIPLDLIVNGKRVSAQTTCDDGVDRQIEGDGTQLNDPN